MYGSFQHSAGGVGELVLLAGGGAANRRRGRCECRLCAACADCRRWAAGAGCGWYATGAGGAPWVANRVFYYFMHGKQIVFEQMIAFELSCVKIVLEVNINLDIQRLSTF